MNIKKLIWVYVLFLLKISFGEIGDILFDENFENKTIEKIKQEKKFNGIEGAELIKEDNNTVLKLKKETLGNIIKIDPRWNDFVLKFRVKLGDIPSENTSFLRVILYQKTNIWNGYMLHLFNKNGKFFILCGGRETFIPVNIDNNWHTLQFRTEKQEKIYLKVDNDEEKLVFKPISYYPGCKPYMWGQFFIGYPDPPPLKIDIFIDDIKVLDVGPIFSQNEIFSRFCYLAYYPYLNKLRIKIDLKNYPFIEDLKEVKEIEYKLQRKDGRNLLEGKILVDDLRKEYIEEKNLEKELEDGNYEVILTCKDRNLLCKKEFARKKFLWEKNTLGITDKVYKPFEPIKINGKIVKVVLREYKMNNFGLWDSIITQGREILASPIEIKYVVNGKQGGWRESKGNFIETKQSKVTYEGIMKNEIFKIKTISTIEEDGCMKVKMNIEPEKNEIEIENLWLEIPLKDEEVELFHPLTYSCREFYAGKIPKGGKISWLPRKTKWMEYPAKEWVAEPGEEKILWTPKSCYPFLSNWFGKGQEFIHYIYLGGVERGLAWFANSNKGYILDREKDIQVVTREGNKCILKIFFINKKVKIDKNIEIVFGLQASPTKPMPDNWRRNVAIPIHSGPVCCWGGFMCADKYPVDYDFSLVDKIIEIRKKSKFERKDIEYFYSKEIGRSKKNIFIYGVTPWLAEQLLFASISHMYTTKDWIEKQGGMLPEDVKNKAIEGPIATYFEEHHVNCDTPEFEIFQDEWFPSEFTTRNWPKMSEIMGYDEFRFKKTGAGGWAHTNVSLSFFSSYIDFAVWYANEWLKRGISLYFDNAHLHRVDNPVISDAYIDEEGRIIPSVSLWEQREEYKRTWKIAREMEEKGVPYPLTITFHTTNTQILPLHTWGDKISDLEWVSDNGEPAKPDFLLTETVARRIGAYSDLIVGISGEYGKKDNSVEWGMRIVHEISRWGYPFGGVTNNEPARSLEKALWEFGYGASDCEVHNYWEDNPIIETEEDIKWLAIVNPKIKRIMLILQSYSKKSKSVKVNFNHKLFQFKPGSSIYDVRARENKSIQIDKNCVEISFSNPYETKVFIIDIEKK